MVDLSEDTVFRTVYEERANQIALAFQTDGRMGHLQSYDYTVPDQLTVTCLESPGGRLFEFVLTTKTSATQVDRDLSRNLAAYDRAG